MNTAQQYEGNKAFRDPRPYLDINLERSEKSKKISSNIKEIFGNIKDIIVIVGTILTYIVPFITVVLLSINNFIASHGGSAWEVANDIFETKLVLAPAERYYKAVYHTYPYTARPGDDLYTLAMRHEMSLEQLLFLNPELKAKPDSIRAHETEIRLRVKALHKVGKSDSIDAICKKYNVPLDELLRANNRKMPYLEAGEILEIPYFVGKNKIYKTKKKRRSLHTASFH